MTTIWSWDRDWQVADDMVGEPRKEWLSTVPQRQTRDLPAENMMQWIPLGRKEKKVRINVFDGEESDEWAQCLGWRARPKSNVAN